MKTRLNKQRREEGISMISFILVMVLLTAGGYVVIKHYLTAILPPTPPPVPPPPDNGSSTAIAWLGGPLPYGFFYTYNRHIFNVPDSEAPLSSTDDTYDTYVYDTLPTSMDSAVAVPPQPLITVGVYQDSNSLLFVSVAVGTPAGYTNTTLSGIGFTFDSNGAPVYNANWRSVSGMDYVVGRTGSTAVNLWCSTNILDTNSWTFVQTVFVTPGMTNYYPDYNSPPGGGFYRLTR